MHQLENLKPNYSAWISKEIHPAQYVLLLNEIDPAKIGINESTSFLFLSPENFLVTAMNISEPKENEFLKKIKETYNEIKGWVEYKYSDYSKQNMLVWLEQHLKSGYSIDIPKELLEAAEVFLKNVLKVGESLQNYECPLLCIELKISETENNGYHSQANKEIKSLNRTNDKLLSIIGIFTEYVAQTKPKLLIKANKPSCNAIAQELMDFLTKHDLEKMSVRTLRQELKKSIEKYTKEGLSVFNEFVD